MAGVDLRKAAAGPAGPTGPSGPQGTKGDAGGVDSTTAAVINEAQAALVTKEDKPTVQTFTTSGTFTLPANAVRVRVRVQGAGGGGGGGSSVATNTACSGGGGGGAGAVFETEFLASDLTSTVAVTVGTGGTGGTGAASGAGAGGNGGNGGNSSFGSYLTAGGGGYGQGGQSAAVSAGGGAGGFTAASGVNGGTNGAQGGSGTTGTVLYAGGSSGSGSSSAGASFGGTAAGPGGGAGGGSGGGITSGNAATAGGTGGRALGSPATSAAAGASGGGAGGTLADAPAKFPGGGGGGGGSSTTTAGGTGGAGQNYGGGGGGGAARTGFAGGNGGAGGNGVVVVTIWTATPAALAPVSVGGGTPATASANSIGAPAYGSAKFPVRNLHTSDGTAPFACYAQPTGNVGTWLAGDGGLVVMLTVPRERMRASTTGQSNVARVFLGNVQDGNSAKNFYARIGGAAGVYGSRIEFFMRDSATQITQQLFTIPESYGSRLLVAFRRTGNTFTIDLWDCDSGTKYAGPSVDVTGFLGLNPAGGGSYFQIGAGGSTNTAPQVPSFSQSSFRGWDGEIGLVGYYNAALSDAACAAIAGGGEAYALTTAATWTYLRQFDGTSAGLTKPSWATGDTTGTTQYITGGGLEISGGSHINARGSAITIDRKIAGDAHVDAVVKGQNVKQVAVSGRVRATLAAADSVEMRLLTTDGLPATPWRKVASVSPGDTVWSGTYPAPKAMAPYMRQFRLASNAGDSTKWLLDATRFSVGYRVLILGQSQVDNLRATQRGQVYTGKTRFSWIEQAGESASDISAINCFVVHDRLPAIGDGVAGIMRAIDNAGCDAVVALELQAVGGTGAIDWLDDAQSGRTWTPMLRANEVMDGGRSCVVWNWDANDIANPYADELSANFLGTGPLAKGHYVFDTVANGGTQIGAGVVYMPVLRMSGTQTVETDYDAYGATWGTRRDEGIAWAATQPNVVVGVPPVDMVTQDWVHPDKSLAAGTERHGQHLGLSILRGLGQDASANPTVSGGSFVFNGGRTAFSFKVKLPNMGSLRNGLGATLDAGADKGVRLIEVSSDGGATWTKSGFTAAITGRDTVTVTKNSGAWAAGLLVRVGYGGVGAYGDPSQGITSGNTAAGSYWLYDGYARHANGLGVPVLPSNSIYSVAG